MAYTPTPFTGMTPEAFQRWVQDELERLAKSLNEVFVVDLRPIHREPEKPREGMIVSADGTDWNPGSGAGAYEYRGGAWVKL